jgi:hypothetical protein
MNDLPALLVMIDPVIGEEVTRNGFTAVPEEADGAAADGDDILLAGGRYGR